MEGLKCFIQEHARTLICICTFLIITFNCISQAQALGVNDGLVGWWKLDEGSGISTADK